MNVVGIALKELYRCFTLINEKYYDNKLPEPVITIQKTRGNNLGHFTSSKIWREQDNVEDENSSFYEININPLNLNRPVDEIMETLNHEMVHYMNRILDVNDCNGNKHNKKFKEMSESVGLICSSDKKVGWGVTKNSQEFLDFIHDVIKPDEEAFRYFMYLKDGEKKDKGKRAKKTFKHVCPSCGEVAKGKKDAKFICGACEVYMEVDDEEEKK